MKEVITVITGKKLGMTCVVDNSQKLLGIITDGDLRRMLVKYGEEFLLKTAGDCMTRNPVTIQRNNLATEALKLMEENKITSLVIQSGEGKVDGVVHLHDLWRTEMF
jgi:arabinose-5-phosphate isomerase